MNAQETKQAAEIMIAYANGRQLQVRQRKPGFEWEDLRFDPFWAWQTQDYRVKPEPRRAPWTQGDVPAVCWLREGPTDNTTTMITRTSKNGVYYSNVDGSLKCITYQTLLDVGWEWSYDPRNNNSWHPCCKTVEV
jgi:hypothetical protein